VQRSSKVLLLVASGTFLTALDVTIVNVAYKSIREDLGDSTLLPWIISGYAISFAAGLLTAGRLADSFGRKRAFLTGIAIFGVSSVVCGLAISIPMLIASRVVQALGAALIVPSATALVMPEFPVERRAAAAGTLASAGGLGAAAGPVLGGILVDGLGWQWIFLVAVPVCLTVLFVGRRLLNETRTTELHLPDFVGATMALVSVALLTLALVQSESWGWKSPQLWGSVIVAIGLGVAFVQRSRVNANPVLDLNLFKLRFVTAANVAGVLYAAGFYAFNFTMIQWLREIWHYSPSRAGIAAIAGPLGSVTVSPIGGRLAQRYGHKRIAVPGLILFALASLNLAISIHVRQPNYWTVFFPSVLLMGVAIGLSISVLSSAASAYLPTDRFAMGSALYATGRQVGGALGIAIVTAITAGSAKPSNGYRRDWLYVTVVMLCAALVMAIMFRPPSETELQAAS
jgi:EmrB/QacA subfamily drug resistance transporter